MDRVVYVLLSLRVFRLPNGSRTGLRTFLVSVHTRDRIRLGSGDTRGLHGRDWRQMLKYDVVLKESGVDRPDP